MPDTGLILAGARPIADFLGVRPNQVYYWAKTGRIPTFRMGTVLCADRAALRAYISARSAEAAAAMPREHEAA